MDFTAISWIGVLLAAIAFFALGGIWYGPLFSKTWMRLSGVTDEDVQGSNMPAVFATTLALQLLAAIGLAAVIGAGATPVSGLWTGGAIGLLIAVPTVAVQALYDRKPLALWGLNGGYNLVGFVAMGAIIGALQ